MAEPTKAPTSRRRRTTALKSVTIEVDEIDCDSCGVALERTLNKIPGVVAAVNPETVTAYLLAPAEMKAKRLRKVMKSAGYEAEKISEPKQLAYVSRRSALALFFAFLFTVPVIAISAIGSWHPAIDRWILLQLDTLGLRHPLYSPTAWLIIGLSAPVVLILALPIHWAGLRTIYRPGADNLVCIASLAAFIWSIYANSSGHKPVYATVAASIILIVIALRYVEYRVLRRASKTLWEALELGSKEVTIIRDGQSVLIPVGNLAAGDNFIVGPGEQIASCGVVLSGFSNVDNSQISPDLGMVHVSAGANVLAGGINESGQLLIRATRNGSDTDFARVHKKLLSVQARPSRIQRRANHASAVLAPLVLAASVATLFGWRYTGHSLARSVGCAIAVMIVSSPGVLRIAPLLAFMIASGKGAKRGIFISEPGALAAAGDIDAVVLDKAGVVTAKQMRAMEALVIGDAGKILGPDFKEILNEDSVLSTALSIELLSEDPIDKAIALAISGRGISATKVTDFSHTQGAGLAGRVTLANKTIAVLIGSPAAVAHATTPFAPALTHAISVAQAKGWHVCVLAWDGVALAMFAVSDQIKADAKRSILELKANGIEVFLATDDDPISAQLLARETGLPLEHVLVGAPSAVMAAKVAELQSRKQRVMVVGNGVSDRAATELAALSIAMGTGTDTQVAVADIVILRQELGSVIDALNLCAKTQSVMRRNLALSLLFNAVAIPTAALGFLSPLYAAGIGAVSSLIVMASSLRVK